MRASPRPLVDGYDVYGAQASRAVEESTRTVVPVFHRPTEGTQLCRPQTYFAGARLLWSTAADARSNALIPRWDERVRAE